MMRDQDVYMRRSTVATLLNDYGDLSLSNYRSAENKLQSFRRSPTPPSPRTSNDDRIHKLERLVQSLIKKDDQVVESKIIIERPEIPQYVPEFDPESNVSPEQWLEKLEQLAVINSWNEATLLDQMRNNFVGDARRWYNNLTDYDLNWSEWKQLIISVFSNEFDFAAGLRKMLSRIKRANESWAEYFYEKMELMRACDISDSNAVSCIIDGIEDDYIRKHALMGKFPNPETLYSQFILSLSSANTNDRDTGNQQILNILGNDRNGGNREIPSLLSIGGQEPFTWQSPDIVRKEQRRGSFERRKPLQSRSSVNRSKEARRRKSPARPSTYRTFNNPIKKTRGTTSEKTTKRRRLQKCFQCYSADHIFINCPDKHKALCRVCKQSGHLAAQCPDAKKKTVKLISLCSERKDECYFTWCQVNNKTVKAFVDTGCQSVILRLHEAEYLGIKWEPKNINVQGYGGGTAKILGTAQADLEVDLAKDNVEILIVDNSVQDIPVIIGQSFINKKTMVVKDAEFRLLENDSISFSELQTLPPKKQTLWAKGASVLPELT